VWREHDRPIFFLSFWRNSLKIPLDNNCHNVHYDSMPGGRQSRVLSKHQIVRLNEFRILRRLSLPLLKQTMDAPFSWRTLKRALEGEPIWELNHQFIVEWLRYHDPEQQRPTRNGKAAAAGEREEPENGDPPKAKPRLRSDDPVPDAE